MWEYRQCLKMIWNTFLAGKSDWDDRDYFSKASVELFRAIVLYLFEDKDRNAVALSAYRASQKPFMPIRVKFNMPGKVRISTDGNFQTIDFLDADTPSEQIDARYVDLFDFSELTLRGYDYILAEVISSPYPGQIGIRLLIPFENAWFEPAA
jgi:hypothetical protein